MQLMTTHKLVAERRPVGMRDAAVLRDVRLLLEPTENLLKGLRVLAVKIMLIFMMLLNSIWLESGQEIELFLASPLFHVHCTQWAIWRQIEMPIFSLNLLSVSSFNHQ